MSAATRYITRTESNKIIRKQLKAAFPNVKFSVRGYGGSTYIRWIDGPSRKQVEAMTRWAEGSSFDGMTDCASSNPAVSAVEGAPDMVTAEEIAKLAGGLDVPVAMLCDYVFTERTISEEGLANVLRAIENIGVTVPRTASGAIDWYASEGACLASARLGLGSNSVPNFYALINAVSVAQCSPEGLPTTAA